MAARRSSSGVLTGTPTVALADSIEDAINDLWRQVEELQTQQRAVQKATQATPATDVTSTEAERRPRITFGGQYRINAYSAANDFSNLSPNESDNQTATRLRLRQDIDVAFDKQFKTHLQFELHHTTDNVTTTDQRRGGLSTEVSIRHAVMDYTFRRSNGSDGTNAQVGIVPLQDHFHQTQFSAEWDYNPLAISFQVPVESISLRLFAANLEEGNESNTSDDFVHYQGDLSIPLGSDATLTFTSTALNIADAVDNNASWHFNYGIGGRLSLGADMHIKGFAMGSSTDGALLGGKEDAEGFAALAEWIGSIGLGELAIMASYATGQSNGTGFLMPMAFAQSYGYWGYTGILTVQGPTDTGFDIDGVNMSNNGYGMSSVQARYTATIVKSLSAYVSAGWFGETSAADRDSNVGTDLLAMGTYQFNPYLTLDVGTAYAKLEDSVSGYFQGVQNKTGNSGAAFTTDTVYWATEFRMTNRSRNQHPRLELNHRSTDHRGRGAWILRCQRNVRTLRPPMIHVKCRILDQAV